MRAAFIGCLALLAAPVAAQVPRLSGLRLGLGLDGRATVVTSGLKRSALLGRGSFGSVFDHPHEPGAVLKVIDHPENMPTDDQAPLTRMQTAHRDANAAKAFESAGAGPVFLGQSEVDGFPVLEKEKVDGADLKELLESGAYDPRAHALMLDLVDKMAAGRILVEDMLPGNFRLGTTRSDPTRRAYLLDGQLHHSPAVEAEWERARLAGRPAPADWRQAILDTPVLADFSVMTNGVSRDFYRPFSDFLEAGLKHHEAVKAWAARRAGLKPWKRLLEDALAKLGWGGAPRWSPPKRA